MQRRRLRGAQQPPVVGLADGDVAGREVGQHRGAGQRGERARRQRDPQVLADLDVQHEARAGRAPRTAGRCRTAPCWPSRRDRGGERLRGRRELALLVELAVVRQVALRHDAEDPAAVHEHGAVEQAVVGAQRQPDGERERQVAAGARPASAGRRARRRAARPAGTGPRSSRPTGPAPGTPPARPGRVRRGSRSSSVADDVGRRGGHLDAAVSRPPPGRSRGGRSTGTAATRAGGGTWPCGARNGAMGQFRPPGADRQGCRPHGMRTASRRPARGRR